MELKTYTKIGDIVKENFYTARIFDQYKIDFCCGGDISLEAACKKTNVDASKLLAELESVIHSNDPDSKYIDSLSPDELCNYIERRHHSYVRESLPFIQQKLAKLCDVHGEHHPELFDIQELFAKAARKLGAHMSKEELLLFPYIRKMTNTDKESFSANIESGKIKGIISNMEDEHQTEGDRLKKIAELSSDYSCPPDGCETFRITYQSLKDFERDLHRHIHLENNILFKKAIDLEKEITQTK